MRHIEVYMYPPPVGLARPVFEYRTVGCSLLIMVMATGCVIAFRTWQSRSIDHSIRLLQLREWSLDPNGIGIKGYDLARKLSPSEIAAAERYILAHPDYRAFHMLIALSYSAPMNYGKLPAGVRAAVLCSALERQSSMAEWSILTPRISREGHLGQLVLNTGEAAVPCLGRLLEQERGVLAGEDSRMNLLAIKARCRICDLAYRYIKIILGEEPSFDRDYRKRDVAIMKLKERLRERDGGK